MNEGNLLKEIGKRLKIERTRLRMNQAEVAELAGCDRSYYCSIERGRRNFTFRTMCRIVAALNRDVAYFLKDMPTPVDRTYEASSETSSDLHAAEEPDEDDPDGIVGSK